MTPDWKSYLDWGHVSWGKSVDLGIGLMDDLGTASDDLAHPWVWS